MTKTRTLGDFPPAWRLTGCPANRCWISRLPMIVHVLPAEAPKSAASGRHRHGGIASVRHRHGG